MSDAAYHLGRRLVRGGMDHALYDYSALPSRPPLRWPGGARVAVVVSVAVEGAAVVPEPGQWLLPGRSPWGDVSVASVVDYGPRVGFFRLAEMLRRREIPATVPMSDVIASTAPRVVESALESGWEIVGHGPRNDLLVTSRLDPVDEARLLATSRSVLERASGRPPRGWMGPRMSESTRTPELAAAAGYDYVMDWGNDDQPCAFHVDSPRGPLVSLPATVDLCDLLVMGDFAQTPWDFGAALVEHLEVVWDEAADSARCMVLTLHAHESGQASRAPYIAAFLDAAREMEHVWFATAAEVVDAYRASAEDSDDLVSH